MDRHEPAPVCEPSVLEAARAITFDHLHKPPDPELGVRGHKPCSYQGQSWVLITIGQGEFRAG